MLWRSEHPRMSLRHRGSYPYTAAASATMAETETKSESDSVETETMPENNSAVPEKMKYHSLSQISLI